MKIEHFIQQNKSFIFIQKGENGFICSDFNIEPPDELLSRTIEPTSKTPWSGGHLLVSPYFYGQGDFESSKLKNFRINHWQKCNPSSTQDNFQKKLSLDFFGSKHQYQKSIEDCIENIKNGDFYQANLLRFFSLKTKSDVRLQLLALLQTHKPAMALWIQTEDFELFSLSPESFIKIHHLPTGKSIVESFPIKGTIKIDGENLKTLKKNIENDQKEVSELNMIIDLVRNDFHKICDAGSVKVPASGKFLTIGNLLHRYAEVTGTLKKNITTGDLLKSVLPAASVTGCPKISANQFIQKHETHKRDFFMGNAFYFDDSGYVDSSVLIRTLHFKDNLWHGAAGSGIVVSSIPHKEVAETEAKISIFTSEPSSKP